MEEINTLFAKRHGSEHNVHGCFGGLCHIEDQSY